VAFVCYCFVSLISGKEGEGVGGGGQRCDEGVTVQHVHIRKAEVKCCECSRASTGAATIINGTIVEQSAAPQAGKNAKAGSEGRTTPPGAWQRNNLPTTNANAHGNGAGAL